jgi:tRNA uridine 5-carboxymethylaminomethyl modification enzyme
VNVEQLLKRPEIGASDWVDFWNELEISSELPDDSLTFDTITYDIKYDGYIQKFDRDIAAMRHYQKIKIPEACDYAAVPSLSTEVREKFIRHKPQTLAQALSIPGVTPAAVTHLHLYLTRGRAE